MWTAVCVVGALVFIALACSLLAPPTAKQTTSLSYDWKSAGPNGFSYSHSVRSGRRGFFRR